MAVPDKFVLFSQVGTVPHFAVYMALLYYFGALYATVLAFCIGAVVAVALRIAQGFAAPLPSRIGAQSAVLITGCSTGIGRDAAHTIAAAGAVVFATVRKQQDFDKLKAEAPAAAQARLRCVLLDVTNAEQITAAVATVTAACAKDGLQLQAVVNNAGYAESGPLELAAPAVVARQFETNVHAPIAVTNAFLPLLRASRGKLPGGASPVVVFVSSVVGRLSVGMTGLYCASKHAIEAVADAYRHELAPLGVRVAIVEPGAVRTAFASTLMKHQTPTSDIAVEPEAAEHYRGLSRAIAESNEKMEKAGMGLASIETAGVFVDACFSARPEVRYRAGWDAQGGLGLRHLLPHAVFDAFVSAALKPVKESK